MESSQAEQVRPHRRSEWICLAIVVAASLFPTLLHLRHLGSPMEDAAMLLRYSQHLAEGHGITWNVGEHPVEGATDFLYMAAIAGIARTTGYSVVVASRILLAICITLLPPTIFVATRRMSGASVWLRLAVALYMAAVPSTMFLDTCFGAPFMALTVGIGWWLANLLMDRQAGLTAALGFAVTCLLLGLIRPEGVILALLMLLSIVYVRRGESLAVVGAFVGVFGTLGLGYFLWRWHYFGYLLPNPFYVKGGGHIHLDGLKLSIANVLKMTWPILLIGCLALRSREASRRLIALLIPLGGFTAVWVLLSTENNHQMRFQFPLVPLALISVPTLMEHLGRELHLPSFASLTSRGRAAVAAGLIFLFAAATASVARSFSSPDKPSSGTTFPLALSAYRDRGYTMAVTEAGQFPFYSGWNAIDTLGLNDAYIAHHGLSLEYLDRSKPELILYHTGQVIPTSSGLAGDAAISPAARIYKTDDLMRTYAVSHSYILAAAYGDSVCNLHFFWVKSGTADTDAIVRYTRDTPYYFLDSGVLSTDYREHVPAGDCSRDPRS